MPYVQPLSILPNTSSTYSPTVSPGRKSPGLEPTLVVSATLCWLVQTRACETIVAMELWGNGSWVKGAGEEFPYSQIYASNHMFSFSSAGATCGFCSHERWRDFSRYTTVDILRIQSRKWQEQVSWVPEKTQEFSQSLSCLLLFQLFKIGFFWPIRLK